MAVIQVVHVVTGVHASAPSLFDGFRSMGCRRVEYRSHNGCAVSRQGYRPYSPAIWQLVQSNSLATRNVLNLEVTSIGAFNHNVFNAMRRLLVRLFGRRWRRHYALVTRAALPSGEFSCSGFLISANLHLLWHVIEDLWDAVEVGPHPLAIAVAVARSLPSRHLW